MRVRRPPFVNHMTQRRPGQRPVPARPSLLLGHDEMKTSFPGEGDRSRGDDLETQARQWLQLLHSGDARALDAQHFRRWVRRSPAHQAAFQTVRQRWEAIEPAARQLAVRQPQLLASQLRSEVRYNRRAFLGVAVGAAAAAGVMVVRPPLGLWPSPGEWTADERTATGERRTLALAEGVDVTLNTRTSARRQTESGRAVGLNLITGEAAVDLGLGRTFTVVAGAGIAQASEGSFEVRHLDGKVCVTCVAGSVRIQHAGGERILQARQQVRYDAAAIGAITGVDVAAVTAWREGALVFDQTRFSEVIDEINRYRLGRVMLMNDGVRSRPVTGRFRIDSLDLALVQLQESFGLRARALPAGVLLLS